MSETIDKNVAANSIVVTGPAGVGKSTVARAVGEAKNLPVVMLDLLRHCPQSVAEIEKRKMELEASLAYANETIDAGKLERMSGEFAKELARIKNELWSANEQIKLRKMFPNVANYENMGFSGDVSHFMEDNFGKVGWHFYQKQFENMLLKAVMQAATEPCVFDLGGGMAVSLDEEYFAIAQKLKALDAKKGTDHYRKNFNVREMGFGNIEDLLKQFSHVVSLQLPEGYAESDSRSAKDELNPKFIASEQYDMLATDEQHKINVGNLVLKGGGINDDRLTEIVNTIKELCPTKIYRR